MVVEVGVLELTLLLDGVDVFDDVVVVSTWQNLLIPLYIYNQPNGSSILEGIDKI